MFFYAFLTILAVWFIVRFLPAHGWLYARMNGIPISLSEFARLTWRTSDPLAVLRPMAAARKEGVHDVTLLDLEELHLLTGDVKPFLYGLIALRRSEFKHLTVAQVKSACVAGGPGFKDLIFRSKKKEEIAALKFVLVVADGTCVVAGAKATFQMDLQKLLTGSRYTTDDLLRRLIERAARAAAWDLADPDALLSAKADVEADAARRLAESGGVIVHEFRFSRLNPTKKKIPRVGLTEDLYEKLKDDVLLDQSIALDREIDEDRSKRRRS